MLAAQEGHIEAVQLLIKKGADVHTKDNNGKTALKLAKDSKIKTLLKEAMKKVKD